MSVHDIAGQMLAQAAEQSTVNPKQIVLGLSVACSIGGYITGQWRKPGKGKQPAELRTAMLWFVLGSIMVAMLGLAMRGMQ
jgi:hypothetical protein